MDRNEGTHKTAGSQVSPESSELQQSETGVIMREAFEKLLTKYRKECEDRRFDFYGAQVDLNNIVEDIEDILEET